MRWFSYTGVRSAKTVDELQGRIQLLIRAFRVAEGREPTAADSGFWTAYAELIQAHEQQTNLGDYANWPLPAPPPV